MTRVRLFHWKAEEAQPLSAVLQRAGYLVEYDPAFNPSVGRTIRGNPPHAFVIDLSRLPSHGREVAVALRGHKTTRPLPIVFTGGDPEKVAAIRTLLPDAAYSSLKGAGGAVRKAVTH